jgi:hypothetical protein
MTGRKEKNYGNAYWWALPANLLYGFTFHKEHDQLNSSQVNAMQFNDDQMVRR